MKVWRNNLVESPVYQPTRTHPFLKLSRRKLKGDKNHANLSALSGSKEVRKPAGKRERGRLPDINSADAWEKRMAEGVAALARYRAQAKAAQTQEVASNG